MMHKIKDNQRKFADGFVKLGDEDFYAIRNYQELGPFLVNVVSAFDLWMFVSSQGGLTAGRVNANSSLFSYETVDRLHDAHHYAGPVTSIRFADAKPDEAAWEPFLDDWSTRLAKQRTRTIYKSLPGNQVVFEERLTDRGLTFRYRWSAADALGFVRTVSLVNESSETVRFSLLDGLRNIQPWGIGLPLQQGFSCLTDAYKRSELDGSTSMGIYSLTAGIVDGTYPTEVLRSNVVWHSGLKDATVCLSNGGLTSFRNSGHVEADELLKGRRGNYFVIQNDIELEAGDEMRWHVVADVGLGHVELADLRHQLLNRSLGPVEIETELHQASECLRANVAASDGLQHTNHLVTTAHHFSNVLFNNMRGGVFVNETEVDSSDVAQFVQDRNAEVFQLHEEALKKQPGLDELRKLADTSGDVDLRRLVAEFLPITFSRRHGDPSRPWNQFSVTIKKPDGSKALKYQGNWRDIFQNWEALCSSFPRYLENVVTKFVNGSTVDGFNPYRVTDEGMEWEEPEADDPWANIGYWGDHQIIYLLKLLEAFQDREPERLRNMLTEEQFVYLRVPYRLKPYTEIVRNLRETVTFDAKLNKKLASLCERIGEDGKLLRDEQSKIVHVSLLEKLLVPMLSKLSNFVVGGGIWMNTQRPEWNDANNALVGNGLSVVTLCYLLRYMKFMTQLVSGHQDESHQISREIALWLRATKTVLEQHQGVLQANEVSEQDRRRILDSLGEVFSEYRDQVYDGGLSGKESIAVEEITELCELAGKFAEHTIQSSYRDDHLYHAYNLADFSHDGHLRVRHLYEMLEGQVAVLSSGALAPKAAADLVEQMYESRLYRPDQNSFMLYPDRELPDFLDKNVIPEAGVTSNPLLQKLLKSDDKSVVQQDSLGAFRFHADFQHSLDLERALDQLNETDVWRPLVLAHRRDTVELFDNVFQHQSYTGRSGTMYGYEGLGCIYWHMVAKLLLAVQENYRSAEAAASPETERLRRLYHKVREGLGFTKSPQQYGAFPTDAYSHTPKHTGAQQPGMTGQVKEEILTRFGELGVGVRDGKLQFNPSLLNVAEFFNEPTSFAYQNCLGQLESVHLPASALAFTYCQTPVVYLIDDNESVQVTMADGTSNDIPGLQLDQQLTDQIHGRSGEVRELRVQLKADRLMA
jgi:hypothetical protein